MSESEISNIRNRPKELYQIPYYESLPKDPFKFEMLLENAIGEFLHYDLFDLDGTQPVLGKHVKATNGLIRVNPSKESIDIYRNEKVRFQLVNLVVNVYNCRFDSGVLKAKPYNISLMPLLKQGNVSEVEPSWVEKIDLEDINNQLRLYHGFNPFSGAYGFSSISNMPVNTSIESDMMGFVISTYALATKFDHNDVLCPGIPSLQGFDKSLQDYKKYRRRHYFKKFEKAKPRKVWGCDSPIELFLLQAMDHVGLTPDLQTHICEDGFTTPSFHKLWENNKIRKRMRSITEADFYFPDKRLAVFCDSREHHSSADSIRKDQEIDKKLETIGIKSLRLLGPDINTSPFTCAEKVAKVLTDMG